METIKIINAHYYRLIREAMTQKINATSGHKVVAELNTEMDLLDKIARIDHDIILLAIEIKHFGKYNLGIQLLEQGYKNLIVVSPEINMAHIQEMIGMGVKGYITKNVTLSEYFLAIEEVYKGGKYISTDIQCAITDDFCEVEKPELTNHSLSKRQRQILQLVKSGFTSVEIAEELDLSPNTVQVHRHNILKKLNMKNTASLIDYCVY